MHSSVSRGSHSARFIVRYFAPRTSSFWSMNNRIKIYNNARFRNTKRLNTTLEHDKSLNYYLTVRKIEKLETENIEERFKDF